jgi:hypothetical protein
VVQVVAVQVDQVLVKLHLLLVQQTQVVAEVVEVFLLTLTKVFKLVLLVVQELL